MGLSNEERAALVAYRIDKAHRTMEQAEASMPLGYWEMTANRLYYAAYYAASALLLKQGYQVQTHNGIIQMLGLHFVKTGRLNPELGTTYSRLFSLRQTGDYGDTFGLTESDVMPLVEPTKEFIAAVAKMINDTENR